MKNIYFKKTLELIGLQIIFSLFSIMFYFSFGDNGDLIYAVFTTWIFWGSVHSTFWQLGRKDKKNNAITNNNLDAGEEPVKFKWSNGAAVGSAFFVLNIILVFITMLFRDTDLSAGGVFYLIHRFLFGSMIGLIPDNGFYWPVCYLLCIIMYLICITAYISGAKNISLIEKLVPKILYKSKDKKEQ